MQAQDDRSSTEVFGLDAGTPQFVADPYPTYHALRARAPVYHSPWGDWYLSRYTDVARVLSSRAFVRQSPAGANPLSAELREPTGIERMLSQFMLFIDPPAHTRLRGLLGKAFTPATIRAMETQVTDLVDRLLDDVAGAASFDLVAALAYPLPVIVIARMLGIDGTDYALLRDWSGELTRAIDTGRREHMQDGAAAAAGLLRYMQDLAAARRAAPRDDLISTIVAAAERDGGTGEEELAANLVMLLWAGHETTKNLIGNAVLALLAWPEQREALAAEPALMAGALEEFLRFDSPVQKTVRWTTAAADFGERVIPPGSCVVTLIGAANRDPAVFSDPDRLDVRRDEAANLAFGRGIHHCVGYAVAKLEAAAALSALIARSRGWRIAGDGLERQQTTALRGPARLPLTVEWR